MLLAASICLGHVRFYFETQLLYFLFLSVATETE